MKHVLFASALLIGSFGCQAGLNHRLPECCPVAQRPAPAPCPAPHAEVQSPEEVVVRAPRQKIVVEMPPPTTVTAPRPAACQPQMPMAPGMMPGMMPQQPVMMPQATAEVRQRTRMGFVFDFIRIPMPIIRPIAVPQPAEMTMTMPVAAAPMMPMPMMPMMPMAAPAMMPMAPPMTMPQQPQMGFGSMNIQANLSMQQLAALLGAQGQLGQQQLGLLMQLAASGQLTPQQIIALRALMGGAAPAPPAPPMSGVSAATPGVALPPIGAAASR